MKARISEPAFPVNYPLEETGKTIYRHEGMTLRDYFASKAMQGIMSDIKHIEYLANLNDGIFDTVKCITKQAYKIADAMIKERKND